MTKKTCHIFLILYNIKLYTKKKKTCDVGSPPGSAPGPWTVLLHLCAYAANSMSVVCASLRSCVSGV